jgi:hypothetical protein
MISTPGGRITSNQMVKSVPIQLGSKLIKTDLVLLNLEGIDVILGTNWMTEHGVLLDISSRVIEINSPHHGATTLYLPQQEYLYSCSYAITDIKIKDIPVVCEYPDAFQTTCLECHQTRTSSSLLNFNLAPLLFQRGRIACLQMNWLN